MNIVSIYPYAIMAYSAFVTLFAVYLWRLTNRNVDQTRVGIQTQVAAAITDIKEQIDDRLGNVEMPALDIGPLLDPLTERLNATIDAKMRSMKGEEANAVRRFLEEQGVSLEQAGSEAEQIMLSQLTDHQLALRKFATMKIPPAIRQNHPEWAALITEVRPLAVDLIQRRVLGQVVGGSSGGGSSGSGFNPGV